MAESRAVIGTQRFARWCQVHPDLEAVRPLDQVEIAAIQVDHRLVRHGTFQVSEACLHFATKNFSDRLPGRTARREHALQLGVAGFDAVLFHRLQEQPQIFLGQPAAYLADPCLAQRQPPLA
ncbi:hypothetical protein D3C84_764170 [compost metagenome]